MSDNDSSRATLNYMQRKALRRLGRGQRIGRAMAADPLIRRCYSTDHYERPRPDMNILEYCDWEARAMSQRPKLTPFGRSLLDRLESRRENLGDPL